MQFAKAKVDLEKLLEKDKSFVLVWIPMIKIKYATDSKHYEMCFDAYTPSKIGQPEAYVLLMRNPKYVKIETGRPHIGVILEPLVDGRHIFEILKELRKIASKFVEEASEAMRRIPRRIIFQLFIPLQAAEAKKIAASEDYIQIFSLLDAIELEPHSEYISEEILYWPLLIHKKENVVFEPALQDSPSRSYTHLHKKFDLVKVYVCEST